MTTAELPNEAVAGMRAAIVTEAPVIAVISVAAMVQVTVVPTAMAPALAVPAPAMVPTVTALVAVIPVAVVTDVQVVNAPTRGCIHSAQRRETQRGRKHDHQVTQDSLHRSFSLCSYAF
jgi:hypothetical protein